MKREALYKARINLARTLPSFLILSLLLWGCIKLERSYPEKRHFMLETTRPQHEQTPKIDGALKVARFRVSPQYEGKGLVYRKGPMSYQSDFYNEFFIAPGAMVTEEVRKWLAESGLFRFASDSPSINKPYYMLEGLVTALYGDYSNSKALAAVLEISLSLIHVDIDRSETVFQKQYAEKVPLQSDSPEALVKGWSEALEKILTALERDLSEARL